MSSIKCHKLRPARFPLDKNNLARRRSHSPPPTRNKKGNLRRARMPGTALVGWLADPARRRGQPVRRREPRRPSRALLLWRRDSAQPRKRGPTICSCCEAAASVPPLTNSKPCAPSRGAYAHQRGARMRARRYAILHERGARRRNEILEHVSPVLSSGRDKIGKAGDPGIVTPGRGPGRPGAR